MCTAGDAIFLKKHSYIAYICEIIRWSRLELSERQWYSYTSFAIYTRKRDDLNNFHRFLHLNQVLLECIKPLNTQHIKLQVVSQQFYVSYQRDVTILKNSSPLLGCKTLQYCLKKKYLFWTFSSSDIPAHYPHHFPLACNMLWSDRGGADGVQDFRTPGTLSRSSIYARIGRENSVFSSPI